ncbi:MAG: fibronectin type III domain-containing protein [Crenarchaeota archaeon]|nr:MAG: fibronectin type III domain-containing protein [Thermoproteota archaeon]RDJ32999.1 MAG: fibronectin type III domain-containing protein [Thermoproteota archaeon]RDJ35798.1 MAG: fibronectin type III domain-containing protein [Thermoproteota archaeon]RDJ36496.1 MAG: fibronectin type III domain-containing protein [Thermoproteota archaeon]
MNLAIFALLAFGLLALGLSASVYAASEPDPPKNLLADDVSPTAIDLYWSAPNDDGDSPITGYKIEFKIVPDGYNVLVANTGSNSTFYFHSGLQTGKTYVYRISAINAIGTSLPSSEAVATTSTSSSPPQHVPPNPPTDLTANDMSPTQIDLTWKKPSANNGPQVTGYKLEKKSNSTSYSVLVNNTASTSYSDTSVVTGTTYTYRVFAINSVGISNSSATVSASTSEASAPPVEELAPNSPSGLSALPVSPSEITLSWNKPASNNGPPVTGYKIEVKSGTGSYNVLADDNGPKRFFKHTGLNTDTKYTYRVYAINSVGLSSASPESTAQPKHTFVPTQLIATDVSPTQIDLEWQAPSQTYGQSIVGYTIQEKITTGVYQTIEQTSDKNTRYSVTGLETDKTYTFVVFARYSLGSSDLSAEASATPTSASKPPVTDTVPSPPRNLKAAASSPIQIDLTWDAPINNGGTDVTGYRIDAKVGAGSYFTLVQNTESSVRAFSHPEREPGTSYTYKVYAINSVGTSAASNSATATPSSSSIPKISGTTPSPPTALEAVLSSPNQVTLTWKVPTIDGGTEITGYKIESKTGSGAFVMLSQNAGTKTNYTHSDLKSSTTYSYRVSAVNVIGTSNPSNLVTITTEFIPNPDPTKRIPGFPDPTKDPQYYVERYQNEPEYKAWFDENFPDFTIYEVVGLPEPSTDPLTVIPGFPDPEVDPQYYVDRYNEEESYKAWFDKNFPNHTIYDVVGAEPPPEPEFGVCGPQTTLINGTCEKISDNTAGGGCLIATAAYGTEMAHQVQFLREVRDNTLLSTESGTSFMTGFNGIYYSFSPTIADWERENPAFREAVKAFITPMVSTLSIMTLADQGSEEQVLLLGISVIALNLGMYIAAPAVVAIKVRKHILS